MISWSTAIGSEKPCIIRHNSLHGIIYKETSGEEEIIWSLPLNTRFAHCEIYRDSQLFILNLYDNTTETNYWFKLSTWEDLEYCLILAQLDEDNIVKRYPGG